MKVKYNHNSGRVKLTLMMVLLSSMMAFFFSISCVAEGEPFFVQLVGYNSETNQAVIHIQNNAGIELTQIDFYVNSLMTGRITSSLADGKAVQYFQTLSPGTYNITIKSKEGAKFSKSMSFLQTEQQAEQAFYEQTNNMGQQIVTASQLANDREYQKLLEAREKEEEVKRQVFLGQQSPAKDTEENIPKPEGLAGAGSNNNPSFGAPGYNPAIMAGLAFLAIFLIAFSFAKKKGED